MLDLTNVTLLCVDSRAPALATWALKRCLQHARFAKAVLMTDVDAVATREPGIEYVQCPPMATTHDYSEVMLKGITPHVEGSHVLIVQWDGFILHPECWDPAFLAYDYIGAVWPQFPETPVGNGCFSLRSRRLLEAMQSTEITIHHPEDRCICVTNRQLLEQQFGIRFAPAEIAERFAVERTPWQTQLLRSAVRAASAADCSCVASRRPRDNPSVSGDDVADAARYRHTRAWLLLLLGEPAEAAALLLGPPGH